MQKVEFEQWKDKKRGESTRDHIICPSANGGGSHVSNQDMLRAHLASRMESVDLVVSYRLSLEMDLSNAAARECHLLRINESVFLAVLSNRTDRSTAG